MTSLLTISDTVKALEQRGRKVSRARVYALVASGQLQAVRQGGRLLVVNLDEQILDRARAETAQRQAPRLSLVPAPRRTRRFGHAERNNAS